MEVKYEFKLIIDEDTVIEEEITVINGDKEVIRVAMKAAVGLCLQKCLNRIDSEIESYED